MKKSLAMPSRIALGVTLLGALALGGLGCGSSSHPNPDAKDGKTGSAGADATGTAGADATGTAGEMAGNGGGGAGGNAGNGGAGGNGGGIQTCVAGTSGCTVWGTAAACGTHQSCTGASGSASCTCNVDPNCASATDHACDSNGALITCGADGDGCFVVTSTAACPAHQTCTGSKPNASCDCVAAPAECSGGANTTFCATSTSVSTCLSSTAGGKTCVYADTAVACSQSKSCTGSGGAAACTCNADPSGFCNTGNTPGDLCSNGTTSVHCALTADSCPVGTTTACNAHSTCNGTSGLCACNAAPTDCSVAGTTCNGNTVVTCAMDGTCLYKSAADAACNAHSTCQGAAGAGACVCNTAPAGCTGAGTFCIDSANQGTCAMDGACPYDTGAASACPQFQTCKGTTLGSTCTCDDTCSAAQSNNGAGGTYCTDISHQASCTVTNGCHISSNTIACMGVETCQGVDGSGLCKCPVPGGQLGMGCPSLGATTCDGNTVLTCAQDTTGSTCLIWSAPNDCTASGLVCGTKVGGGASACQCPDHTGTDYIADWKGGSAPFPTGVDSPPECRFKTLTEALAVATTAGDRVIARSAVLPAMYSAETFPLAVSAGVTLKGDVVSMPVDYVIEFNSAGASAVSLANSSVLEGFTINYMGGTFPASAVLMAGTGVTVDTVDLTGPMANGISVTGQGSINAANIMGFQTGINFASASGVATTLSNSLADTSSITGIDISSGTLTASGTTVSNGSGDGVDLSATGTLNATSFIVKNNANFGISVADAAVLNLPTGDEIGPNTSSGITTNSGTVTLGGVNIHNNLNGLMDLGGAVTIGSGGTTLIQSNSGGGVSLSGATTLTVGTATITNNGSDGVFVGTGATLVSNTGAQYTNNMGNGINESSATLTFNGSASAPIVVSGNKQDGILMTSGNITASYLTLSSNGTGTGKAGLEVATGVPAVNIGVAVDSAVSITGNGVGVKIGSPTLGTAIDVHRASITSNLADGIDVDLNWGTTIDTPNMVTKAAFTSVTVSNNKANGVVVTHAPPLSGAVKLTFDSMTIANNSGIGVWLDGAGTNDIDASVKNSKIQLNTGAGLKFQQNTGSSVTTETIQNSDINQNTGGGVVFSTSSTLASFQANLVHGNSGNQITVSAAQNGGGNWNMRSIGLACDANRNQIYGYGGTCGTGAGILVNSGTATTVDAENVGWVNAAPGAGTDFVLTGAGNNVLVASPCAQVTACP